MTRCAALWVSLFAGCDPPTAGPADLETPPDLAPARTTVSLRAGDKIDLLFAIDNSPSMTPMQAQLKMRFPALMAALSTALPADYHIGVVTSDLGSGPVG